MAYFPYTCDTTVYNPKLTAIEAASTSYVGLSPYSPYITILQNDTSVTNAPRKTGIYIEQKTNRVDGVENSQGIAVNHWSNQDSGGDASGISVSEHGNGNAGTFFNWSNTAGRAAGFALEVNAQQNSTAILVVSGGCCIGVGVAAASGSDGITIGCSADTTNLATRYGIRVGHTVSVLTDYSQDGFRVTMDGATSMNSTVSHGETSVTLAGGANQNVAVSSSLIMISGPGSAFSIGGIVAGRSGQIATFINTTGQAMTVKYADGGSSAANQILTSTQGDVACGGTSNAWFTVQYSTTIGRWFLLGHS